MCMCDASIKTPFCGKGDCVPSEEVKSAWSKLGKIKDIKPLEQLGENMVSTTTIFNIKTGENILESRSE